MQIKQVDEVPNKKVNPKITNKTLKKGESSSSEYSYSSSEEEANVEKKKKKVCVKNDKPRKKRVRWTMDESKALISLLNERNILALMDNSPLSQKQIFAGLESAFQELGYNKTYQQMLNRYKNLHKGFKNAKSSLKKSGESAAEYVGFKYFEEMNELINNRPVDKMKGVDSCDINQIRAKAKQANQEISGEEKKTNTETTQRVKTFQPRSRKQVLQEALENSFQ